MRSALLLLFFCGGAACGTLSGVEAGAADGGTDAAAPTVDAGGEEREEDASSDIGDAAPGDLLVNGDFENGCDAWMTYHSTLAPSADGGLSGGACEACVVGAPADGYSLAQIVDVVPVVGKRYVGQMWLRVGGAVTGKRAYVVVRTFDADGGEVEATGNQPVTLTTDYESVGTTLLVTKPAARLEIYSFVEAPTAPGDCFFADDATLVAR